MRYLVAAFCDRTQAEEAYTRLEANNFPTNDIAILGKGYKTTDEFGLQTPQRSRLEPIQTNGYLACPLWLCRRIYL